MPLPAYAEGGASAGAALRRGAAAGWAQQWPVLAAHIAQSLGTADHGQPLGLARHGPHHSYREPEAARASTAPEGLGGSRRQAKPAPDADAGGTRAPRRGRLAVEEGPRGNREAGRRRGEPLAGCSERA